LTELDYIQNFKLVIKLISEYASNAESLKVPLATSSMTVQMSYLDKLVKGKVQEVTELLQAVRKVYLAHFKPIKNSDQSRGILQLLDEHLPVFDATLGGGAGSLGASLKRPHPFFDKDGGSS
jgi:hypothetical protein